MTGLARSERAALSELLELVGPDHPTLCEGWQSRDLLNHLLMRDRRPDSAAGLVFAPLAGWTARVTTHYAALSWGGRLHLLRTGPPRWSPLGWGRLDELVNGAEFFIHHEDVRRGAPGWQPRDLDSSTRAAVVAALPRSGFGLRRVAAGVTAVLPEGRTIPLRKGRDRPIAEVHGEPGEIMLWASGRSAVQVRLGGEEAAVAALRAAGLGG